MSMSIFKCSTPDSIKCSRNKLYRFFSNKSTNKELTTMSHLRWGGLLLNSGNTICLINIPREGFAIPEGSISSTISSAISPPFSRKRSRTIHLSVSRATVVSLPAAHRMRGNWSCNSISAINYQLNSAMSPLKGF